MDMGEEVIVNTETYHEVEGIIEGKTADRYYLVKFPSGNGAFFKEEEMERVK